MNEVKELLDCIWETHPREMREWITEKSFEMVVKMLKLMKGKQKW